MMNGIEQSLRKASISLHADAKRLLIKSEFYFWNKGNMGMLLIGFMGLAAIILAILKVKDTFSMVFVIALGITFIIFTFLGVLKQVSDFVEFSRGKIRFSNSLKKQEFLIRSEFKIKVKSSTTKVKRRNSPASYFRVVELFLKTADDKIRILDYQMDQNDSAEADELGKEIKRMMKERLTKV